MDSEVINMIAIRFGIFAGIMLFCFPFLLGFAFRCIEPVDFGIAYNANSKQIDSENLYYSGRHYVGLGHFFKRFPIHQLALIFSDSDPDKMYKSVKCRSKEGLQLHIHIFLAYKLTTGETDEEKTKELIKIYNRFQDDYEKFIILMVHSVIRNVAAEYSAFDFFEKRSIIGDEMFSTLKEYFEEYYFKLSQLYIINMEIPESFDESILETEIVNQQIEEKTYLKSAKMIEGNTSVLEAQYDAQILILKAKAQANKTLLENQAIANSTKYVAQKQLEALKSLKTELNLVEYTDGAGKTVTVGEQILEYIWIYQLKQMKSVVLGLQQPVELDL